MLEKVAHFNDLSPDLRKSLEERVRAKGKEGVYKFAISNENPDPEKVNGKIIWPANYTLDPVVFDIIDEKENRPDKSKVKKIGLVQEVDEKGLPKRFRRIRIHGKNEGVMKLDLTEPEGFADAMYLELHPKVNGGLFQDKKRNPVVTPVDEKAEAGKEREIRKAKTKAFAAAERMSNQQVKDFAAAMVWDENEDVDILRNRIEQMAEDDPKMFIDLVESENIKYQSTIKRAMSKGVVSFDPVGGKFLWGSNQQVITVLGAGDGVKNEVERFGEFLRTGGTKADEIFKKIESLTKV